MGGNGGASSTRTVVLANLFVNTIGWTILLPVFPEVHAFFNANTATVGSLASLVAIFTLVCGTIQGYASDYFGRLFMLQVSAISQLLGHLLTLLALYCGSYYLYVVARCIPALLKCTMVVTQAYMYDLDNALHSKDMKIGSMFAFSNFSFIVGPLIGGAVIGRSIYLPSIVGVVLSVVELYLLTLLPSVPPAPVVQDRNNGNSSGVQVPMQPSHSGQQLLFELLQVKFAYQLCNAEFEALFAQLARERLGLSARVIGRLFSLSGAMNMFLNLYVLDPVLRHQPERFLGILLAVTVVGLVIWGGTNSLPWLVVAVVLVTAASNLFLGILQGSLIACLKGDPAVPGAGEMGENDGDDDLEGCSPRGGTVSPSRRLRERRLVSVGAQHPASRMRQGWQLALQGVRDCSDAWYAVFTRWASARVAGTDKKEDGYVGGGPSRVGGGKAQVGAVFGLSASVDRAARVLSPLLSGLLVQRYGERGLVLLTLCMSAYCSVLLQAYLPHASDVSVTVLVKVLRPQGTLKAAHNKTS